MLIPTDQIPEEVLDEIKASYCKLTWDNYGKPTRLTSSRRLKHREVRPLNEVVRIKDPWTFENELVHGLSHVLVTRYRMRGRFKNNIADIYAVISTEEPERMERYLPT